MAKASVFSIFEALKRRFCRPIPHPYLQPFARWRKLRTQDLLERWSDTFALLNVDSAAPKFCRCHARDDEGNDGFYAVLLVMLVGMCMQMNISLAQCMCWGVYRHPCLCHSYSINAEYSSWSVLKPIKQSWQRIDSYNFHSTYPAMYLTTSVSIASSSSN